MRVALSFEIKRLPHEIDKAYGNGNGNGDGRATRDATTTAAATS
jgi:hypothetical protein